ncbi:SacI homology domain-containing protein [Pseudomassariella vexata]|uniref:SacI homology domain-domain-containing protein n=1 Tax=Pseudomassariella vexata TaxID=1141098 RepID=A0A1Y2DKH5_9PEZI|nr:SacI homology domain-containing protein [Pseudomassariella vexata]ORY59664.1 SacI homology domain-domain-containing protein [Pseudomassariella vexata]
MSTPRNGGSDGSRGDTPVEGPQLPAFPLLQNNASSETLMQNVQAQKGNKGSVEEDTDDEPIAQPFVRTRSPDSTSKEDNQAEDERAPARLFYKMHKFTLYETASWYYIVGGDVTEKRYRILKIDRNTHDSDLSITDDKIIYNQKEMNSLLDTIDDGNKRTGGIKQRCTTWGLLGFIKFTGPYYMLLITKKSTVAMVGGHYIYQVDGTELIPLTPAKYKPDVRNTEESRFLGILNNLDLTRSFYYSYSYDITRTLQHNLTRERIALSEGLPGKTYEEYNSMFVWNSHLLQPANEALHEPFDWCRPIIHGYIDQAAVSIYGRTAHITIIARRSRYFAGARFLKRGANDLGYVANDVETEQIVSESLTTSFHSPGPKLFASPQYTSYVQHRGSIPLYWSQDNIGVTPKPPIELNLVDPFYTAAALHFDNLFERYGSPIYALNLVKARERTPRESKLLDEYTKAVTYLNQFLPEGHKIIHKAWDMSRAAKSRDQDVIGTLESIAESVVTTTGFFQNGDGEISPTRVQNGVARTNCIDCLDRTNAAQFVIGKRALGHQLYALGILENTLIEYDTDAVNLFTHMYHDHGDTIAVQYGGSQLVNTMETYRKINQWTSHSRDMIESFKRYYNNSFMDSQRQEAYNLFLGNYIFSQGQPMLWDLSTDYYLHHADPRTWLQTVKHDYIHWFNPQHLEKRFLPPYVQPKGDAGHKPVGFFDDYWLEYYRPSTLSSFLKMFPYKMNSTIKYIPFKSTQEGRYDLSPFRVRNEGDQETHEHKKKTAAAAAAATAAKKGVTIVDPHDSAKSLDDDADSILTEKTGATRGISIQRWLQPMQPEKVPTIPHGIMKETVDRPPDAPRKQTPQEKSKAAQWTFTKVVHESLNPSVSAQETEDYTRYISHPQSLPLVVSNEAPIDVDASEYQDYLNGNWQMDGLAPNVAEGDISAYWDLLRVGENPLTVTDEDLPKKRYKAYRKWLRGKSLFKQQPVD